MLTVQERQYAYSRCQSLMCRDNASEEQSNWRWCEKLSISKLYLNILRTHALLSTSQELAKNFALCKVRYGNMLKFLSILNMLVF